MPAVNRQPGFRGRTRRAETLKKYSRTLKPNQLCISTNIVINVKSPKHKWNFENPFIQSMIMNLPPGGTVDPHGTEKKRNGTPSLQREPKTKFQDLFGPPFGSFWAPFEICFYIIHDPHFDNAELRSHHSPREKTEYNEEDVGTNERTNKQTKKQRSEHPNERTHEKYKRTIKPSPSPGYPILTSISFMSPSTG